MKKSDDWPEDGISISLGQTLRQKAEEIAKEKEGRLSNDPQLVPYEETQQKIHELLVHQIELEMQNDELRRTQAELEEARARYLDLYGPGSGGLLHHFRKRTDPGGQPYRRQPAGRRPWRAHESTHLPVHI